MKQFFSKCHSQCGGCALFIVSRIKDIEPENDGILLPQLTIQYSCFQDCYGRNESSRYEIQGVCLYSAAVETRIYYASSVNCSTVKVSYGAQYNMQAETYDTRFLNLTGGNAIFTTGIEYKIAHKIVFIKNTIYTGILLEINVMKKTIS